MPVEGRDDEVIIVTFTKQALSYNEHDVAAFLPEHAQELIDAGVAVAAGPNDPPVNLARPFAQQEAALVNCTMGEWTGEPTSYVYNWQSDGADVGDGSSTYPVTAEDAGKTMVCIVTATNAAGSGAAPPSNAVIIAEVAGTAGHSRRRTRS